MKKSTALKYLELYYRLDPEDLDVIIKLYERIEKNNRMGRSLVVSDWRTASSRWWKGTSKAELARRLGLSYYTLDYFYLYKNWVQAMEELADKYEDDFKHYRSGIDYDEVLRWALRLMVDNHDFSHHRLYDINA